MRALGQSERSWLAGRAEGARRGRVGARGVKALGGVETGRGQAVGPGEAEDPAQHPQGVGHVPLRQAGRAWRLFRTESSAAIGTRT